MQLNEIFYYLSLKCAHDVHRILMEDYEMQHSMSHFIINVVMGNAITCHSLWKIVT